MIAESLSFLAALAVSAALVSLVDGFLSFLGRLWGPVPMPEHVRTEMSPTDRDKIVQTQALMARCFGDDAVDCIRRSSNTQRILLTARFAQQLAREVYGLDIEVDVTVSEASDCGTYSWKDRKAVFNIALLMRDGSDPQFGYGVRETLDTIVHELRHAVQHQAIRRPGFWNVDEDRRALWAGNMTAGNYIRPEVDLERYSRQPVEADAFTFAALVMKEVR